MENSIFNDIKQKYNIDFINNYIINNFDQYCDERDMKDEGYTDKISYYKEIESGNNWIEYDIIQQIWDYVKLKYNINLLYKEHENLKYDIEYYIKDIFPNFELIDYRYKKNG